MDSKNGLDDGPIFFGCQKLKPDIIHLSFHF